MANCRSSYFISQLSRIDVSCDGGRAQRSTLSAKVRFLKSCRPNLAELDWCSFLKAAELLGDRVYRI